MVRVRELAVVACVAMLAMSGSYWTQRFEANGALQATVLKWPSEFTRPARTAAVLPQKPVRVAGRIEFRKPVPVVALPQPMPKAARAVPAKAIRVADPAAPVLRATLIPAAIPTAPPPALESNGAYLHQAVAVADRVRASVPAEIFPYFDTYLYVSKSASGAWAQHMFVFHKTRSGRLAFEEKFPVSTGRERREKYFTSTPTGLFELDPNRFDAHHRSHRWNGAPMPWAMFLNYTIHNHLTGIAMHSGVGHVALLGHRASGGCVRMPPQKAEEYFHRFQASEHGLVPVFAFDNTRGTTRTDGMILRDMNGMPVLTEGYRVLLIIQNYRGRRTMVAGLS